ncbi:rhodanese-like domain-containing protein [Arthrobacter sp. KFRI-F3372]|uniref:rhodanese-like domain-containing protein n=1 Tax=Micrococcaceae TaxID=1268 RepID=UPI00278A540D|nr:MULTISPECIES: rhodanese-like domain-containing protein [Micrococcaceae]MDP9988381.1 rhodanese-related sulfurtransferase [Arthrobacter oryzae]MEE2523875.1 rhodanese-like domain-containing protein [Pseudarthrobacter sp. J47]MEE2530305.1 rhodanese-like domain-containing protein [Pseudarthrobacter sp. J75]WHP61042.1 rhodanese-like domain-containing protein [Arthrobacter sp. KFRI-F3372]
MAATRTITADDLAAIWPAAVVVDVRSAEEYAVAHIPDSLNIPLDDLPSRLKDLPNTPLHLLCGSGKRSSQAAQILTDHGYKTVNVAGGITEWYRNGHPVIYAAAPVDTPPPDRWGSLRSLRHRLLRRAARTS